MARGWFYTFPSRFPLSPFHCLSFSFSLSLDGTMFSCLFFFCKWRRKYKMWGQLRGKLSESRVCAAMFSSWWATVNPHSDWLSGSGADGEGEWSHPRDSADGRCERSCAHSVHGSGAGRLARLSRRLWAKDTPAVQTWTLWYPLQVNWRVWVNPFQGPVWISFSISIVNCLREEALASRFKDRWHHKTDTETAMLLRATACGISSEERMRWAHILAFLESSFHSNLTQNEPRLFAVRDSALFVCNTCAIQRYFEQCAGFAFPWNAANEHSVELRICFMWNNLRLKESLVRKTGCLRSTSECWYFCSRHDLRTDNKVCAKCRRFLAQFCGKRGRKSLSAGKMITLCWTKSLTEDSQKQDISRT